MTLGILYHMPFWQSADGSLWEAEGSFARYVDSLAPYFDRIILSVPVFETPPASGSRVRAANVSLAPLPFAVRWLDDRETGLGRRAGQTGHLWGRDWTFVAEIVEWDPPRLVTFQVIQGYRVRTSIQVEPDAAGSRMILTVTTPPNLGPLDPVVSRLMQRITAARESGDMAYFDRAEAALRKSLALDPRQAGARRHLAYVLYALSELFKQVGAVELNIALTALIIGSALLLLSAFWHQARSLVVRRLPAALQSKLPNLDRVAAIPAPAA